MKIIKYSNLKAHKLKKIREDLEKYCGLDTQAMINILDKLTGAIK